MRFTKMQGLGNDYIYVNGFEETVTDAPALARRMSDRHFGVGSDGLVLILPSARCDLRMVMYNADGSRGAMCGNASRCVAKYAYERALTRKRSLRLETDSGDVALDLTVERGKVTQVRVDMGAPVFEAAKVPCLLGGREAIMARLEARGRAFEITAVSMGNPHAVVFEDSPVEGFDLRAYGPAIERHSAFPDRVNAEFVNVLSRSLLRMRVWERGSGETLACGTGACAAFAAARRLGKIDARAQVALDGGTLTLEEDARGHLLMTGPAEFVFDGEYEA